MSSNFFICNLNLQEDNFLELRKVGHLVYCERRPRRAGVKFSLVSKLPHRVDRRDRFRKGALGRRHDVLDLSDLDDGAFRVDAQVLVGALGRVCDDLVPEPAQLVPLVVVVHKAPKRDHGDDDATVPLLHAVFVPPHAAPVAALERPIILLVRA
ncbi:MAG: hypothetical protein CL678_00010 [Bdellovibrionaceae bacterium]|nr:hypothetical protein [Pseudobdellovibrionaceae bacterium]